jgi:predicted nucleic acid-binding protein
VTKISQALDKVGQLYIDTMPFIYFVERNLTYVDRMRAIIRLIDSGQLSGFSSVITLTEVLTIPIRNANRVIEKACHEILVHSNYFTLYNIDSTVAEHAAELRASYNLKTPAALQIATAVITSCQAFLTNDKQLRRVSEIRVLVLDELEL